MKYTEVNNLTEEQILQLQYTDFYWQDDIHLILKKIDKMLEQYGLELNGAYANVGPYLFKVIKR